MNIDISKEQKAALSQKVSLCVEYLKKEIQPNLASKDKIILSINDDLDLYLTNKKFYIKQTHILDFNIISFPLYKRFLLEKTSKTSKKFICTAAPEFALEFLKQWDKMKYRLQEKVIANTAETDQLNDFIDNFKL